MFNFTVVATQHGPMAFAWSQDTVQKLVLPFPSVETLQDYIKTHWQDCSPSSLEGCSQWVLKLEQQFIRYFSGHPEDFSWVSVNLLGSSFKREVYQQLRDVKAGETISYEALGRRAGRRNCARAVGSFMSGNPIPLLIPCHRVLASNGKVGAFSAEGGVAMKLWMLRNEGCDVLS